MGKDRFVRKKASRMNYRELRKGELQRIYLLIVYARSGDVAGGQLLQVLVGASLSWRGAHPGNGSRAYGSSLVDGGVVEVCGATRRSAQMAWAKAEVAAGGRGCSLTTVP
jgi:hypothetical protein